MSACSEACSWCGRCTHAWEREPVRKYECLDCDWRGLGPEAAAHHQIAHHRIIIRHAPQYVQQFTCCAPDTKMENKHYSDSSHVYLVYPGDCIPPCDLDDRPVLLVEKTERAARNADVHGAIYRYTFKDGYAQDEQFVGLTKLCERIA